MMVTKEHLCHILKNDNQERFFFCFLYIYISAAKLNFSSVSCFRAGDKKAQVRFEVKYCCLATALKTQQCLGV